MRRQHLAPLALAATAFFPAVQPAAPEEPLLGFSSSGAAAQRALEQRFDAELKADNLRKWMKRLTAHPHHVGSPHGRANAEFIAGLFRSWGYDTRIEVFHVLFPTPEKRALELLAPELYSARLFESPLKEDRTSGQVQDRLPPYNAYSIDGNVRGEVVYVNYGIPDDYEELERRGISVEGKIVLARYGGSWRGIKPKVAAEKGAIGCILYSDPRDDGYGAGDVYPEGGFRPGQGVQRGSVADMPLYPGDPLTPSVAATEGARRLDRAEAPTLTKIPVLPISYEDARPILRNLGGPVAPRAWRGGLPLTYHLGPGPAEVRLEVAFDWSLKPAYDVIATLEGSEFPDEWILRGNHHDAWVNGATDPISGLVALLEEARAVASLTQNGWRPPRTLIYAAWDAEEPGLLGSTEWVEAHAAELREKAVVYINTDSNSRGFLRAGGSHTLEIFFNQFARDVPDPRKDMSVAERRLARVILDDDDEARDRARGERLLALSPLGSGSDYTPFLQHLGIASLNLSFGGEGKYGQYHSAYDSYDHYTRFMDPGFDYGLALARTTGRAVLRLAAADVLPFEFGRFTKTVAGYVEDLADLCDRMRTETEEENRRLEEGLYEAVSDPEETYLPPEPDEPVPHLNFAPLHNAVATLEREVARYDEAWQQMDTGEGMGLSRQQRGELNAILFKTERKLTRPGGLPGREWFVHHVYAPGFYTGYGVKTLPGVREAVEERRWGEAEEQITVAAGVLAAFSDSVARAATIVENALQAGSGATP